MCTPKAGPSASCLAALAAAAALAQPAEAADRRIAVEIEAGPLARSLATLAFQAGISIGTQGPLPDLRAPRVSGRMTAEEALNRLLAGSPLRAERIDAAAFRLVPAPWRRAEPPAPRPQPQRPPHPSPPPPLEAREIVVTGLRRPQALFTAPAAMSVLPGDSAGAGAAAAGSRAVAERIDGLTVTNLGEGRNRQFIRGVADSAFNGYSQSTVAIVLDGARITYDAPDPDLRLVDVDRVEVLKGPQGPLYGSGALGGVYHIVTNRPDLRALSASSESFASALRDGDAGLGGSATLNLPLLRDRLALRASAYGTLDPGWIDDGGGPRDVNSSRVSGGRAALRWRPVPDWTVDLAGMAQFITVKDSQYVPVRAEAYRRPATMREPHDNDIRMASAGLSGLVGAIRVELTASLVRHEVSSRLDASAAAAAFGEAAPLAFSDDRNYRVADEEIRLSGGSPDGLSWIVGASYLGARTRIEGLVEPSSGAPRQVVSLSRQATEAAAYGQASLPLGARLRADLGLRLFRATSEDELEEADGTSGSARLAERRTRLSPSLSLSWSPSADRFLYARFARAERAAGLGAQAAGAPTRFGSDRLTSVEIGGRARLGGLQADAAFFHSSWTDVQSDYLLASGLIATHNAGDAAIWGGEASLRWQIDRAWSLSAGGVVQQARLVRGAGGEPLPEDTRLPVVPDLAGRIAVDRKLRLGGWSGDVAASLRFNGSQRLSFDPGLDRRSNGFAVVDLSARLSRGAWTLLADLTNLLGARADTFGFGNPFSIREAPQYTPLRPTGARLALRRNF